jgi:2-polyprenyl-6-methoxyphenol hydroxylase-like FAD-dependent oxidoreductase
MSIVDPQGQPYITIKGSGEPEQQSLISEYEIFRDDLARILYELTKDTPNIHYVFGEQASGIAQEKDRVTVDFANGCLPRSHYDLVIAADGATSRTRALGLACKVRDHIHSLNAWAAYCTISKDLLQGSKMAQFSTSTPGRAIILTPDHDPAQNRVVLMGSHARNAPSEQILYPFHEAVKKGDEATKTFLSSFFRGHRRDDILAAVMASDNLYASEAVQVKVPSLYNGRFVLVGDAGYAAGPVGTGTSLAITGAYLLAGEISNHPGDVAAGLRSYETKLQPIIRDLQRIPPGFPGVMTPQSAWALEVRNGVLRFFAVLMLVSEFGPVAALLSWIAGLFSSSFGKDKYGIMDYEWTKDLAHGQHVGF